MALEVDTVDAPAYWAGYLINGDASSFDFSNTPDRDKAECDAWLDSLGEWYVVSDQTDPETGDSLPTWIGTWKGLSTEMITYVVHRQVSSK